MKKYFIIFLDEIFLLIDISSNELSDKASHRVYFATNSKSDLKP